ncbi:uncharacterized protein [Anas acuta]|uniref:uncharacterized protein n=1 Tax=Anas acuta TaxID=28680 RepID=UPI0035C92A2A
MDRAAWGWSPLPPEGNKWCRNPGKLRDSGERRPERRDQPGGEDAPGPTRKMETLVKVVSKLWKLWGGSAEEARGAGGDPEPGEIWERPRPCAPQNGAELENEETGEEASCGNGEEVLGLTNTCKGEKANGCGDDRGGGRSAREGQRADRNGHPKKRSSGSNASLRRRRGEPRGRERPARRGGGQGQDSTGGDRNSEVSSQPSSDSGSDSDSNSEEEEMGTDSENIPNRKKAAPRGGEIPLRDGRKIKIACAVWALSAVLAFPVWVTDGGQRVHSPINPKDVQAIVKAIADKGLHSAMISTLIDGVFGGDNMLLFDIKQTCRLIFDGGG